jgi:thiol:disulfide interchange protein DsbC
MMRGLSKLSLGLASLLMCAVVHSNSLEIKKAWIEDNPAAPPIDSIIESPIAGLYEVHAGSELAYIDAHGDHLIHVERSQISGHIFDLHSHVDLTALRQAQSVEAELATLPYEDALAFRQGSGAKHLVVFEDPNCHYCKNFEKSLAQLKDVTIHTFIIPILGPDSKVKARDIWCSVQNSSTWRAWMLNGSIPESSPSTCDIQALSRNTALARKFGVRGTPSIIFGDGTFVSGSMPFNELKSHIDESPKMADISE